jgi:hypothetical protein
VEVNAKFVFSDAFSIHILDIHPILFQILNVAIFLVGFRLIYLKKIRNEEKRFCQFAFLQIAELFTMILKPLQSTFMTSRGEL